MDHDSIALVKWSIIVRITVFQNTRIKVQVDGPSMTRYWDEADQRVENWMTYSMHRLNGCKVAVVKEVEQVALGIFGKNVVESRRK